MVTPAHLQRRPHLCPSCGRPMNPPVRKGGPWKCRTDGCKIALGYLSDSAVRSLIRGGLAPAGSSAPLYVEVSA